MNATHFYSSGRFGMLAKRAVERSESHSPDAYAAIVFGVLWIEAFLNEVLHQVATARDNELPDPLRQLQLIVDAAELDSKDSRLESKLQTVLAIVSGAVLDRGAQPFQDFHLLVQLRNHLVHHRPETVEQALEPLPEGGVLVYPKSFNPRIRSLMARGVLPQLDPKVSWSLNTALERPAVAIWAFETSVAIVLRIINAFPSRWQQKLSFSQRAIPEVASQVPAV